MGQNNKTKQKVLENAEILKGDFGPSDDLG